MTSTEKIFLTGGAIGLFLALTSSKSGSIASGMIGEFFSFDEFTGSATCDAAGIPNEPNSSQVRAGKLLAKHVLDPLRECLGDALTVSSWLRTDECNDEVGGVPDSTHMTGGTADVKFVQNGQKKNWLIMRCLLSNYLPFDRVLIEHGTPENPSWIHIEFDPDKDPDDQDRKIWIINNGSHGYPMTWNDAENLYL